MGVERIAEMQAYKGEVNELVVEDEGEIEDYGGHGWNLLKVGHVSRGFDDPWPYDLLGRSYALHLRAFGNCGKRS